jgi:hypothetical protein
VDGTAVEGVVEDDGSRRRGIDSQLEEERTKIVSPAPRLEPNYLSFSSALPVQA